MQYPDGGDNAIVRALAVLAAVISVLAAALALPSILLFRTVSRIAKKRKHVGVLVKSIPMISVFVTSWGVGEVVGYLFGPGDSLAKVR